MRLSFVRERQPLTMITSPVTGTLLFARPEQVEFKALTQAVSKRTDPQGRMCIEKRERESRGRKTLLTVSSFL